MPRLFASTISKQVARAICPSVNVEGIRRQMQTRDSRFQYKTAMPHTQLSLHHTENARLLPDRGELLHRLPHGGVCAEVGAAFGDFTAEIFEKNAPRELYLIDAWDTPRYQEGLEQIKTKFRGALDQGRLRIVQGYSTVRLSEFPNGFFDWVYIDTNHSYETTLEELQISHFKVKQDGRIAGHDFCTGNVVDAIAYGVVEACTKFCKDFHWQFEYMTLESHGHFSFSLKRL
jgi:hypothetical protein